MLQNIMLMPCEVRYLRKPVMYYEVLCFPRMIENLLCPLWGMFSSYRSFREIGGIIKSYLVQIYIWYVKSFLHWPVQVRFLFLRWFTYCMCNIKDESAHELSFNIIEAMFSSFHCLKMVFPWCLYIHLATNEHNIIWGMEFL